MSRNGGGRWLVFYLMTAFCAAQEILRAPSDTTVFLGQSTVFTCETNEGFTGWIINGTIRADFPLEILKDLQVTSATTAEGTNMENLTIPARAEYNGTTVQCVVVKLDGSLAESDNVTLQIQGPLSAVGDLRTSNDASSVTIWWTAPFSLDVTGVDPDIWYSVLIYNVTDEDNQTAILCTNCTNITETYYTFTPGYISPRHLYAFSVTPFNGAGQGETSHNTTGFIQQPTTDDVQTTGTSTPPPRPPSTVVTPSTPSEESRQSAAAATAGGGVSIILVVTIIGVNVVYVCRMRRRGMIPPFVVIITHSANTSTSNDRYICVEHYSEKECK